MTRNRRSDINKEHGILFRGEMVTAIIHDKKTQTRRVVKDQPVPPPARANSYDQRSNVLMWESNSGKVGIFMPPTHTPRFRRWDILWVRETFKLNTSGSEIRVTYRADGATRTFNPLDQVGSPDDSQWRPSIFMPRWASRMTLLVTDLRVEPLQDITEQDAIAEGVSGRDEYKRLWDSINGKENPWDSNPWVVVYSFETLSKRV